MGYDVPLNAVDSMLERMIMAVPNDLATVDAVAAEGYFVRVAQGDQRAASLFARLVAYRLNPNGDESGWGWLTKSGAESQVDGYAEDSIVFGKDPSDLNNVVDIVAGTGAPGATTRWGPAPRRASNRWEAPRPLSATDLAYLRGDAAPGPMPTPGSGWEPKHAELLARFPAQSSPSAAYVRRVAEQFAFSFPDEWWGHKMASPGRPPSTDVMARSSAAGLVGHRIIPQSGAATAIALPGQVFIAVTATNHLGVTGPGPTPIPGPTPTPEYPGDAYFAAAADAVFKNYESRGEAVNRGVVAWISRMIWRVLKQGQTIDQAVATVIAEMPKP